MRIALAALALLLAAGGGREFENPVYGHALVVPPGWVARLAPESGTTNVLTYSAGRLDRLGQPPPRQVRVLTPRANEFGKLHSVRTVGRSYDGRPIRAWRIGNPRSSRRILVVGCIHGSECAGTAVTAQLVNLLRPIALDLWVIQSLNPDGLARGTRGNARGVDLNRDFDTVSQRETRIAQKLILRLRPDVTVWFHQPQAVVRAWGRSRSTARHYARLAGERYRSLPWPPGSATRWQNGLGMTSFVVELARGKLEAAAVDRHAGALLQIIG